MIGIVLIYMDIYKGNNLWKYCRHILKRKDLIIDR